MIPEPLSTIQSIQEAVKQDPSLRVSLAKKYLALGGTLSNGSIPLPYKEDMPAGYTKTSNGVYQPTVLTSANKNEQVIPNLNDEVKNMSQTGTFVDSQGVERYADQTLKPEKDENAEFLKNLADFNRKFGRQPNDTTGIKKVSGGGIDTTGAFDEQGGVIGGTRKPTPQEEELDTIYNQQQAMIDQMKASLDASTKRQIDSIEAQFAIRKQQMEEINRRQEKGIEQTLLMGGSSRYAQLSSAGVVAAKERDSLMKIAELDAQEKELVNAALSAQETGDFKLLEKKIELAETKRKEKQKEAETLSKAIADENKKLREEKVKLDEADRVRTIGDFVSDSISSGITDVNEIYRELRKNGIAGSDAEVNKALKNLYTEEELKKENPLEKLSIDFRDFDYLSNSPNRGGLPDSIQSPIQYIQYRRQIEQDIKNNANTPSPNGISPADSPRGTPDQISISSLEDIKNLPISDLTKAYMSGFFPGKPTPTDARTIAEELYKVGFNPKQYINRKLEGLVALYASIPEEQKGLLEGFIKPWAKYTQPTVGTFESARAVLTREVARLNDVGVLSDQDVKSYTDAMPSRMDKDITQVIAKLSGLQLATGGKVSKEAGKTGTLKDGRKFIIGTDGKTLLDPNTGEKIQ